MDLTIKNLENCFTIAKKGEYPYVGVKIQMKGFNHPEVIINPIDN